MMEPLGNAVVNGMYSFYASAYTDYWNNAFGQIDIDNSATLSWQLIWQAFVQEFLRTVAADQDVDLKLNDMLPINDVTREAFSVLDQRVLSMLLVAILVQCTIAILLHWLGYKECLGILEKTWIGFLLKDKIISILMIGLSCQTERLRTILAPTDFTVLR